MFRDRLLLSYQITIKSKAMTRENIKLGFIFNAYYGNGSFIAKRQVVRLTPKGVVTVKVGETRESYESMNTVIDNFKTGIYRLTE